MASSETVENPESIADQQLDVISSYEGILDSLLSRKSRCVPAMKLYTEFNPSKVI